MANFENRNLKVPSKSLAPDMYNWHSLLKPVGYSEDVFKICLVAENGEEVPINRCEYTIENAHYPLLLRLDKEELDQGEIIPIKRVEIWTAGECQEFMDLGKFQEGFAHFLVTNLDKLATGKIEQIRFIAENNLTFKLQKKPEKVGIEQICN